MGRSPSRHGAPPLPGANTPWSTTLRPPRPRSQEFYKLSGGRAAALLREWPPAARRRLLGSASLAAPTELCLVEVCVWVGGWGRPGGDVADACRSRTLLQISAGWAGSPGNTSCSLLQWSSLHALPLCILLLLLAMHGCLPALSAAMPAPCSERPLRLPSQHHHAQSLTPTPLQTLCHLAKVASSADAVALLDCICFQLMTAHELAAAVLYLQHNSKWVDKRLSTALAWRLLSARIGADLAAWPAPAGVPGERGSVPGGAGIAAAAAARAAARLQGMGVQDGDGAGGGRGSDAEQEHPRPMRRRCTAWGLSTARLGAWSGTAM